MKQKEYPMDDDYNRALEFLTEQIAERDELAEQIKILPPAARPEALRLLQDLNKAIERGEEALAKEYEAFQTMRRLEEERDAMLDEATERMAGVYIHVKYRNPDMLPQMEEIINKMPPEESKVFYESVARQEAGDLVRIIRREGETREEAEEFLKNYRRRAEEKRDETFEDIAETMAMMFIHIKYRHPDKFEEVKAACLNNYTPEEEQDFYDRVARLEAEDLIGLIAQQGETREQTEEFLKNYRAAKGK